MPPTKRPAACWLEANIDMKWSLLLFLAAGGAAAAPPRLFSSRVFPGSAPAYLEVTLEANGDAAYREAVDDELPVKFHLNEAETREVFGLADKLDHFTHPLEAPVKVAFIGTKTFRWENGAEKGEVKFNYSEDLSARALQEWFERMAESAEHRLELERTAKYDRLGLVNALNLLASAYERKRLVALDQFLPMLDRVSNNENYMHTARATADLDRALGEAGTGPLERVRAIEKHLAQYPDSPRREELEQGAANAAIAANDDALIVTWGERVLARQPADLQLLARVTHSLLAVESKDNANAERAIRYAHRSEELIPHLTQEGARLPMSAGEWQAQADRAAGRALTDEAHAAGYLGRREEALALAQRAFATWPNADSRSEEHTSE